MSTFSAPGHTPAGKPCKAGVGETHALGNCVGLHPVTGAVWLLILASVAMSSLAQIALKAGMMRPGVAEALSGSSTLAAAQVVGSSPMVWVGLGIYGASTIVWMHVLAKVDVSLAYPFVGLGFVLTMLLGWLIHGEALTPGRIGGTLLIVLGVVILGRS